MYIRQFSLQSIRKGLFFALFCLSTFMAFAPSAAATCGFSVEGIVFEDATCGNNNGRATVVLRGGIAPFGYSWSNGATSETATGLTAGTYTVTIVDATACVQVQQVQVSNIGAPTISNASSSSANCLSSNGGYTFSLTGSGSYDIAWSGAASGSQTGVNSPITIPTLPSGDYNLTVTDVNGCRRVSNFAIGQTGNINMITTLIQAPNCGGGTNGILRITATSGTLPFEFFLNGVSGGSVASNVFDFASLSAGTYTITVRDGSGCTTLANIVSISESGSTPIVAADFTISNATCPSAFTGSIVENVPSGTPYQVFNRATGALVGGLPQTTLDAGDYELRLDNGGCISRLPFSITDPTGWNVELQISNSTCTAGDADILMRPTGGTPLGAAPFYNFTWSNGANTRDLTNVVPDFYRVSITDAAGCTFVSNDILVPNCSSRDSVTVLTGANIIFCVDTSDVAGAVATIINDCAGSNNNGTINSIGADGCVDFTAGATEGIDTICVVVCNAAGTSCDTTTIIVFVQSPVDTFSTMVAVGATTTLCPDISPLPGAIVSATNLNCQPLTQGNIVSINPVDGCVTYTAGGVMGFDTVCVVVCDAQGFCDTSILIFGVQSPADTATLNVTANTEGTYCPDLTVFGTAITSAVDLGCSVLDNGSLNGINTANGCVRYQAGNIAGTDTVCLVVCDGQGFCDTTVIVFNVVPAPDTVRITLTPGAAPVDTCLYNIQFPGTLTGVTNLGCDANTVGTITVDLATGCVNYIPPTPQPGSGLRADTVCLVACDNSSPIAYCDTVIFIFNNIEPVCGGAVPDVISSQVLDCNAVAVDVCLPIPLDSIGDYQVLIDGAPYTGNYGGCAFITRIQYPFVLVPACSGDFIISWTINGTPFGPAQVTGLAGIVAQLNTWDTATVWTSTPNNQVIVGTNNGDDNLVYGNLSISCLGAPGSPTILGPTTQQQYADGAQIQLNAIGNYRLTVIDQFGCVDTSLIRVVCVQPSSVIDTVFLDSIVVNCNIDYSQIQTLATTTIGCTPTGNVSAGVLGSGCLSITGLTLGVDSFCVIACDTFGICDTTFYTVFVLLPPPIATNDDIILPFATTSITFDICTNDTIPLAPFSVTILQQPTLGSIIGNDCGWTFTRRSGDVCGLDSFQYEVSNSTGRDTAWVLIDVQCLPFSISQGLSPNGDGLNDRFIINSLTDYPDHEIFIFNRWGNIVFRTKNYGNDWEGTFNGNPLPDGTYFYLIELNNARNEVFNGFFILQR
jgi:gliding motility-associated-like protein